MRRCKDDWVNATQILKLCNFPKAKRTKILEKGVQQGLHEKVQGGYGRFQGTWIPLDDARNLAAEYGISAELVPVLYIDLSDTSVVIPKKSKPPTLGGAVNKDGTPVKRKYVKRKKDDDTPKKMRFDDNLPPQAVFKQDYPQVSRHNSHAADMLAQVPGQMVLPPTFTQQEFMPKVAMNGYRNYAGYPVQNGFQPPLQRMPVPVGYVDDVAQQLVYQQHQKGALSLTNDTNWSQEEHTRDLDTLLLSVDAKHAADDDNLYSSQLFRYFSEDNAPIPYFLYNPPPDFNINEAIDEEGHLALHWAASIGNLNMVHFLLAKGANPLEVSNFGLNSLSKCVSFSNCYDLKNFPHIVDSLEMCLINTDINGRTPLHYICQFSKVQLKLPALTYYVGVIFNKLSMMANAANGGNADLIRKVIEHPDVKGDTCLHLAARAGSTELVKFFLSNGASDDVPNNTGETARAIILLLDLVVYNYERPAAVAQTPAFQVPRAVPTERGSSQGLGTPIQPFGRPMETPDTQRTTIQDDDEEEVHDRVSKEHLRTLLEEQAGTVDDNKENIFMGEPFKANYDSMSTPKQAQNGIRQKLAKILEKGKDKPSSRETSPAPFKNYAPKPPQLDEHGNIVVDAQDAGQTKPPHDGVKIPTNDVKLIMHGMINSLANSYEQELSGLSVEFKRINSILVEKKQANDKCAEKVKKLLDKNGFREAETLDEARETVDQEVEGFEQDLRNKELQLVCSLEKAQAFELANLVHENESSISMADEEDNEEERWRMGVELTKVQLQRSDLVDKVARAVKEFAISNKMNKYRKLISLSCGLRVEDIDGLIDGIEESLMDGTL